MQLLEHFASLTLHPKNAQELKGLILQLAIQGKLTANWREENPDTEPSFELFKQLKNEKQPIKLRKEDIPYNIPKKWNWYYLVDLSSINGGFAFKSSNYTEDGVRVIRISDFDENGFKNHKIVRHLYTDTLEQYVLEDKNILIAMTGGTVGKSLFVDKVPEIMVVNQRVATIKIKKTIYEAYINCVIPTKLIQDVINEAKNSTNDNISMSDIKGFKIPLPPLEEQKEIVRVVEVLFKEVEQLEQLTVERIALKNDYVSSALQQLTTQNSQNEWQSLQPHFKDFFTEKSTIKKLRETVLQLAVQGKLTADWRTKNIDFEHASELLKRIQKEKTQLIKDKKIKKESPLPAITKEEIPYELPEGWVWCRFGELITFLNGYAFKSSTYVPTSDYQIIRLGNVKDDNFLINTKEAYVPSSVGKVNLDYQIFKDDILTTLTGTKNRRDYCFTCLVKPEHLEQKVLLLNQRVGCIRAIDKSASELINKFLKSDIILNQLFETETGTANQGNIGSTAFKNLVFPLPPLAEQKAIVEKVNALMGLCDALEQEVAQSKGYSEQLMQSVLREVFEGEKN